MSQPAKRPNLRKPMKSERGMSLLETLFSISILGVGLLGLQGLGLTAAATLDASQKLRSAVALGQQTLEAVSAQEYSELTAGTTTLDYGSNPAYPELRSSISVQPDTPEPGMKTVLVEVAWKARLASDEAVHWVSVVLAED